MSYFITTVYIKKKDTQNDQAEYMEQLNTLKIKDSFENFLDFWIDQNEHLLPEQLHINDLVKLGLFSSRAVVKNANIQGRSPEYHICGGRCVYRKKDVLQFIKDRALHVFEKPKNKRRPNDQTKEARRA